MDRLGEITQHLLRFSPDALIIIDESGTICFANNTVKDLFGYESADLLGCPVEVLVPERLRGRHGEHVSGFLKNPRNREMAARIANLSARRADGSEFPASIRLAPWHIGDEFFVGAAIRDTTERTRINEALVAAREEADRANRAKSRFLATASHDLRQPLQTIRLLNAAMLKLVDDTELCGHLQLQEQAIVGMTRLLNGLLDISRLESGAIEPHPIEVRLQDVLQELKAQFEPLVHSRDLALEVQPSNVVLLTDRVLFSQLLENILGNAVKYTDRGKVSVSCTLSSDALLIDIEDTGVGIPADKIDHIFDEYYQVNASGARRPGVGLGLAIVREVARLLGYSITVTSRVGEGTRVRISVAKRMLSTSPGMKEPERTTAITTAVTRRPRIILVEDNPGVRAATELFLKLEGFETNSAASACEAESLVAGLKGDVLVIADYHLEGGCSGLEFIHRIRALSGREIPAIVLSGDLPSVLRSVKSPLPSSRVLSKPVDTQALMEAIAGLQS